LRLAAFDLAENTGWAAGDNFVTAQAGLWRLPGYGDDKIDRTLASLYSAVNATCRAHKIEGVLIEAALRTIKKKNSRGIWTPTSAHGDRCLTMLQGAARAGAANAGAKIMDCPAPNTWRAAVLGHGFPKDPKAEALQYCRRLGHPVDDHNTAEALCILQFGLGKQNLLDRIKP
jgi:hypothetical protein